MTPAVTVVVPSYNHARYLPRRLESIYGQDFRDLEVVLVDDGSTDGSLDVVARHPDPRLAVLTSPSNSGSPFQTWNRGLRAARGRYVWIAESDDAAEPAFLGEMVRLLDASGRLGVAYCLSSLVGPGDEDLGSDAPYHAHLDPVRWTRDYVADGREECARHLVRMNTIPSASAVVFRRELALEVGLADPSYRLSGDHDLWARMLLRGADLAYVARPLSIFRRHGASVRGATYLDGTFLLESLLVARKICAAVEVPFEAREWLLRSHARIWYDLVLRREGQVGWGRSVAILRSACRLDPGFPLRIGGIAAGGLAGAPR